MEELGHIRLGKELAVRCPLHQDTDPSLRIAGGGTATRAARVATPSVCSCVPGVLVSAQRCSIWRGSDMRARSLEVVEADLQSVLEKGDDWE